MMDLLAFGPAVLELSPPADERLEAADHLGIAVSGSASGVAVAAARLGSAVVWSSRLPTTALGRRVAGGVRRHGVETAIRWSEGGRQGLAFTERGSPDAPNTRVDDRAETAAAETTPADLPLDRIREAKAVYTGGGTPASSATLVETTASAFEAAREAGTTTVLGLSARSAGRTPATPESLADVLSRTDVLVAGEADAKALADRARTPTELVHGLAAEHGLETVVLARREQPSLAWYDATVHERGPLDVAAVDDRGAFPALAGAFLARLIDGESVGDALAAGVACAALCRTTLGPMATVTPREVDRMVERLDG
jgi:2-dehydro-3-deoxygluconokinase